MTARPAIFQDQNVRYEANTCDALKEAWEDGAVSLCAWLHQPYPGVELAADYLPELRTIGMWDAGGKQRWGLERHCNEGIEFTYLASGHLQFSVDGNTWELKPGQLTMTRPWQFHQVGQPEVTASKLYWFILDVNVRRPNQEWCWPSWLLLSPAELRELTSLLSHNEHPVWDASDAVRDAFEALIQLLKQHQPGQGETAVKLGINALILALLQLMRSRKPPLNQHLSSTERVVEIFLQALPEYSGYAWTLDQMAGQCGISRSQFSTYCRKLKNMTPVQYVTQCRLEKSAALLVDEPLRTVSEIAYASGFKTSQYFASNFRKHYGKTPGEYRKGCVVRLIPETANGRE